eukprot:2108765-Pyramimonas_sp.AAC.1
MVPLETRKFLAECIQALVHLHRADFHRRLVHLTVNKPPWNLLVLAKRGKDIRCPLRVDLARRLLSTSADSLEVNSRKFVSMFRGELQRMIDSDGKCPGVMWTQVALWCEAETTPSDNHSIEGINNMIISTALAAPTIRDPLLSSRVVGRLALFPVSATGKASARSSVKEMQGLINEAIDKAVSCFTGSQTVMSNTSRWQCPPAADAVKTPTVPSVPLPFPPAVMEWARHYNSKFITK